MKILVTGAGGLIGTYVARAIDKADERALLVYKRPPPVESARSSQIVIMDLLSPECSKQLASLRPDAIVHCAAVIPKAFHGREEASETARMNRVMDDHIIELTKTIGCPLVYLSTTSIYGTEGAPWSENSKCLPLGSYSHAKEETERKLFSLKSRTVILRISAPYGPEQRSRTVLKIFIENAMHNVDLTYHGSGQRRQDFTSAQDIAEAVLHTIQLEKASGIFNIAGGRPISMLELGRLVLDTVPWTKSRLRPSGQDDLQEGYRAEFDIRKAASFLDWKPRVSLSDGIRRWIDSVKGTP